MSSMLLILVLSAPTGSEAPRADTAAAPRPFHEIHGDIRQLLRREATAEDEEVKAAAVYQMTQIYRELLADPRLARSPTLQKYKARLWGRLTKVKNDIERRIARRQRRSGGDRHARDAVETESPQAALATCGLAEALQLSGASLGGPAQLLSQAGGPLGGAAGPPDYGPALVSLIERTISPEFWDVNGGPGAIVYYRPLMVLVVSATSDVHHRLGGALGKVREAK